MASYSTYIFFVLFTVACSGARTPDKLRVCHPAGVLHYDGSHTCGECCKAGQSYPQYKCSPAVSSHTKATLTVNDFEDGGDGGDPSECDNEYHNNSEMIVALSTGWYAKGSRCGRQIVISANGVRVQAKVVDECDSVNGCDKAHAWEPPCDPDIVDASPAVWEALGISKDDGRYGYMDITWTD